jgi:tetratricopeptide (TPR) repeat protein
VDADDAVQELGQRLHRYPPDRYPVQHATTQFHLGQALLQLDRATEATAALRASWRCFPDQMAIERGKVSNLLGAALRMDGHLDEAAVAFAEAAAVFEVNGLLAEHGAALFNMGLLRRDGGDAKAAAELFTRARDRFASGPLGPRAAAALHLGTALLELGEVDAATASLQDAVELGRRLGDRDGVGAAANALGLAHLAAGRPADAVDALELAAAAHPRAMRPAGFAMAMGNLAVAHEAAAAAPRARLAARQALSAAEVPEAVRAQAEAVLERLGPPQGSDLLAVLDEEPQERWAGAVRGEVARWSAVPPADRRAEVAEWIDGIGQRPEQADALIHAWLSALLEVPPDELDALIASALGAGETLDPAVYATFRSRADRVMAWFPVPQLLRLRDRFEGLEATPVEGSG